jgi:hypothetical protein
MAQRNKQRFDFLFIKETRVIGAEGDFHGEWEKDSRMRRRCQLWEKGGIYTELMSGFTPPFIDLPKDH